MKKGAARWPAWYGAGSYERVAAGADIHHENARATAEDRCRFYGVIVRDRRGCGRRARRGPAPKARGRDRYRISPQLARRCDRQPVVADRHARRQRARVAAGARFAVHRPAAGQRHQPVVGGLAPLPYKRHDRGRPDAGHGQAGRRRRAVGGRAWELSQIRDRQHAISEAALLGRNRPRLSLERSRGAGLYRQAPGRQLGRREADLRYGPRVESAVDGRLVAAGLMAQAGGGRGARGEAGRDCLDHVRIVGCLRVSRDGIHPSTGRTAPRWRNRRESGARS